MDDIDEVLGPRVRAVLFVVVVCVMLAVIVPTTVTVWAARSNRKRLWLVFVLAFVGVVSAEVAAIVAYLALSGDTGSHWAVTVVGTLSIASFIAVARRLTRMA